MLDIPSSAPDDPSDAFVDQVMAMAQLPPAARVVVIGHHTLPFLLALMRRGSACVRSVRPDVASPDGEATDLVWIVDVANENELCEALQAARRRTGTRGRVIVGGKLVLRPAGIPRRAR